MQPPPIEQPAERKLTSITLDPIGDMHIELGTSRTLAVKGTYDNAETADLTRDVSWVSSDPSVVTAGDDGQITAVGKGNAWVTVNSGSLKSEIAVVVSASELFFSIEPIVLGMGASQQLSVVFRSWDGVDEDATARAAWASSDPSIAWVSDDEADRGMLMAYREGQTTVTAWLDGLTATIDVTVECAYPMGRTEISLGSTMPPLYWSNAVFKDGSTGELNLETAFCHADWSEVRSMIFIVSAAWCPGCPDYVRHVDGLVDELEAQGSRVVFVEIEKSDGSPAHTQDATRWLDGIVGPGFGYRVGDADTHPAQAFRTAPSLMFLPTAYVVRRSDMKIVGDQASTNNYLDFVGITQNIESF